MTEYCIMVADPRGSGCFRPVANTVTSNRAEALQKLAALRVAFPAPEWAAAKRNPPDWSVIPVTEEEVTA